ncbi:MAG: hypothetical protein AAF501_08860 [Pseudomonadota bacterium]
MRRTLRLITLMAALACAPALSAAESPLDLMFNTPHFAATASDAQLSYRHTRRSELPQRIGPDLDSRISVALSPAGDAIETVITLDADGAARRLDRFQGVPGNPILMVFMETLVSSLSRATGGSPFYLRNRLKESFEGGEVVSDAGQSTILLKPFQDDRNRERMGPFADMTISMELDRSRPGMFEALTAQSDTSTDLIYFEEMRLENTD